MSAHFHDLVVSGADTGLPASSGEGRTPSLAVAEPSRAGGAPRRTQWRAELPSLGIALVFALASAFGINAYQFATGDNAMTIPFAKAIMDPRLYPGDFLTGQLDFYYTYLWRIVALLAHGLGLALPWLFFGAFMGALVLSFYAMHRLARTLFGSFEVATLALFFLLLSRDTIGGVETTSHILTTRGLAIPLLLLALDALLRRRIVPAFALAGVAYLIHPLTTHYVLVMLMVGGVVGWRPVPYRGLATGLLVFLGFASPLLIWKFLHTPPSFHLFSVEPGWIEALRLRSAHHMFPFRTGVGPVIDTLRVAVILGVGWHYRNQLASRENRMMAGYIAAIVAMCVLGYVFTEVVPLGGALLAQPMRSFMFLEYFACLYIAHYLIRAVAGARHPAQVVVPVVVTWGILYAGPREGRAAILYAGVVGLVVLCRWRPNASFRRRIFVPVLTSAVLLAGAASLVLHERRHDQYAFSFGVAQPAVWLDVQYWARANTDRRDGFIVPPRLGGSFRMESERSIYADWEDGGLMNANPAYGIEWLRRMRMLGLRDTATFARDAAALGAPAILRIAREMRMPGRHVFLVTEGERPELGFRMRYRNARFVVYEVPTPRGGLASAPGRTDPRGPAPTPSRAAATPGPAGD